MKICRLGAVVLAALVLCLGASVSSAENSFTSVDADLNAFAASGFTASQFTSSQFGSETTFSGNGFNAFDGGFTASPVFGAFAATGFSGFSSFSASLPTSISQASKLDLRWTTDATGSEFSSDEFSAFASSSEFSSFTAFSGFAATDFSSGFSGGSEFGSQWGSEFSSQWGSEFSSQFSSEFAQAGSAFARSGAQSAIELIKP